MRPSYDVVPHEGAGRVRLGMSRPESRTAMGLEPDTYEKHPGSPAVDAYHQSSFQVFFDEEGRVEFVELSRGDDLEARLGDVPVLDLSVEDALAHVERLAGEAMRDVEVGVTFHSRAFELSLWRESREDEHFQTVGVARRGYWDR